MTTPQNDQRVFIRDLSMLLGVPILAVSVLLAWWRPWKPRTYVAGSPAEILAIATGVWDWADADSLCLADPHTIDFSPDHRVMILTHRRSWTDSIGAEHRVAEYDIQVHDPSFIRGVIRGERRRTADGAPVVWDLVLTSRDSYAWHRTDWASGGRTKDVTRCPPGTESLVPPP